MGLKLKWFRRRLTFEGIPSAPERSIRKKEQNTGITTIGVYRQSVNYEDYIEPSRSSYWEPPSQPIATTTIRRPNTYTSSSTTANKLSSSSPKYSTDDKIASRGRNNGQIVDTPPEPSYSPPKPPSRRALSKTKSTPNVSVLDNSSTEPTTSLRALEVTRSVEVLNEVTVEEREIPVAPAPRNVAVNNKAKVEAEKHEAGTSSDRVKEESSEQWKQQQPEFFNEILQKVNVLASTTKSIKTDHGDESETESYDDIFEKVKAKPRLREEQISPKPQKETNGPLKVTSRTASSSSIEDIFEPRPPEIVLPMSTEHHFSNPSPRIILHESPESEVVQSEMIPPVESNSRINHTDTPAEAPLKSILKKRAPAPPQQPPHYVELTATPLEVPTPPPRTTRKQPNPPINDNDDDDDDDYLNWNMVERHRSSITHTVASQRIDPEIMRNVPTSLQQTKPLLNTRALLDEEPSRTLRGMRNRRTSDEGTILGLQGRNARNSESNRSEASA